MCASNLTRRLLLIGSFPNSSQLSTKLNKLWLDLITPEHFHLLFIPFITVFVLESFYLAIVLFLSKNKRLAGENLVSKINTGVVQPITFSGMQLSNFQEK